MYTTFSGSTNMGTLDLLPATTYRPPSPGQARRRRRSLNTIMEDEEDSNRGSMVEVRRSRNMSPRKADWLSPLSDHFPTPRGIHFMSAPIPPSSVEDSDNDNDIESVSPTPSSAPWTRDSYTTEATEFDDLYDASSDEEKKKRVRARAKRNNSQKSDRAKRSSGSSTGSRASLSSLPSLAIPSGGDPWPGVAAFKLLTSPVPPTPPPKVPMSPAIFKYLQSQEVPSCSAPPSLDGSLSSEQMAVMSAPPTPDVGNESGSELDGWGGVQLQPAAMATLQALSGGDEMFEQQTEQVIELTHISPSISPREMQQSLPPLVTNIHRNDSIVLSPEQQRSMNSLTRLEIPSPGGFFSALSPGTRHTWHLVACTPESAHPPSSTTAEHFYKTPWSNAPVERIIEVSETASDGIPTARPNLTQIKSNLTFRPERPELRRESSDDTITGIQTSPVDEEVVPDEILANYTDDYATKLNVTAVANLDRTGLWLAAQSTFLSDLINPTEARDDEVALLKRAASTKSQVSVSSEISLKENPLPTTISISPPRKTVRFSDIVTISDAIAVPLPSKLDRQESAYYRAFQHFTAQSRYRDTFIHRIPRFEALQAQRVSFSLAHRAYLLGKYQLSVIPMSAKRRLSANVARGDEIAPEDPEKLKRDKEHEARQQMSFATWNVQAIKLLNGGRLIAAPVAKRLARLSSMGPKMNGAPRDRARILDLGGQATCDWAWHCAVEYPNTKVYTITTKSLRQLSNSNIRGPKNHRNVAVERLVRLPFRDNQFDLISAREIYTILREQAPNGENEWESCLKECYRILKPGGYLEFSILDSDIVNAGPVGLAKSVEFGFTLRTLGYDPSPTKTFISRLSRAGFTSIKRAWVLGRLMGGGGNRCRSRAEWRGVGFGNWAGRD
ncbi:related to verprolin [Phialocephala subalpina]|uniref:Related to verprolin n=1 Tax=Phialocephala subalpina TaxID=576137 RepID=A0A1L7WM81_9HELO|nr:related to verprolin [Phialocephala subalpina]